MLFQIVLIAFIGFVVGLGRVIVFDASILMGLLTYFMISVGLSCLAILRFLAVTCRETEDGETDRNRPARRPLMGEWSGLDPEMETRDAQCFATRSGLGQPHRESA